MSNKINTDIDIDVADRKLALGVFPHIVASIDRDGTLEKHNTGVYFQAIPHDVRSNISSIDHKEAEKQGYFKIDFLNVSLYEKITDEGQLKELVESEPPWEMLKDREFVEKLFHIGKHYDLVFKLKPKSIEQLAAVLAIIRPAKRYLENASWDKIMKEVWIPPKKDEYYFKKAHSFAYAMAVVVQMNMLKNEI
jgi:hypothetical protein